MKNYERKEPKKIDYDKNVFNCLIGIREDIDMQTFLILILFQVLLIYLKVTNFIDWSWFWVLFPMLSQLLVIIAVIILAIVSGVLDAASGVLDAAIRKLDDEK